MVGTLNGKGIPLQGIMCTHMHTLGQFSRANPPTGMFLGSGGKLGKLEEAHM